MARRVSKPVTGGRVTATRRQSTRDRAHAAEPAATRTDAAKRARTDVGSRALPTASLSTRSATRLSHGKTDDTNGVFATNEIVNAAGGKVALCDVSERTVLSFLPYLPDRIKAERVCKRWLRLSQHEVPIRDLDFSKISMRKVSKSHLKMLLLRAASALTNISLPGFSLDDACLNAMKQHTGLLHLRAYTMSRQQILELLRVCTEVETLELLDCQLLIIVRWEDLPAHLRVVRLYACHAIKTPAISSLIAHSGGHLRELTLTGAEYVDSTVLRALARHASALEELTISYSRDIRLEDLKLLVEARWQTLRVLDLTSCSGFDSFSDETVLTRLEVLILDNTKISDSGLRAIAAASPNLKYLSLQDCVGVSDQGLIDLSAPTDGSHRLELLDLKGTRVTDVGVDALDAGCVQLRMLRLDSCRNVSRALRLSHGERTRQFLQCRAARSYERMAMSRIATPEQIAAAASLLSSESESENDSDASYSN